MVTIENFAVMHALLALAKNTIYWGFAFLVFADYGTGVLKSAFWKVTDSSVGLKGIIKHTLVILSVGACWVFLAALHAEAVASLITAMYALNYLISILENLAVMGIWVPPFIMVKVKQQKKRYEEQLAEAVGVSTEEEPNGNESTSNTVDKQP